MLTEMLIKIAITKYRKQTNNGKGWWKDKIKSNPILVPEKVNFI